MTVQGWQAAVLCDQGKGGQTNRIQTHTWQEGSTRAAAMLAFFSSCRATKRSFSEACGHTASHGILKGGEGGGGVGVGNRMTRSREGDI